MAKKIIVVDPSHGQYDNQSPNNPKHVEGTQMGHLANKLKPVLKSVDEIAKEVIQGKWGNGSERKRNLTVAGYDYSIVQARVNELCK